MVLRICWTNRTRVEIITFVKWLLPMKFYLSKLLNKMLTEFMFASHAILCKNRRHSKKERHSKIDDFDDNTLYFMYSNLLLVKEKKKRKRKTKWCFFCKQANFQSSKSSTNVFPFRLSTTIFPLRAEKAYEYNRMKREIAVIVVEFQCMLYTHYIRIWKL